MSTHTPVFHYDTVSEETAESAEQAPEVTEEIDISTLEPHERLAYFQRKAEEAAALRKQVAELQAALSKAQRTPTSRARKDPERDARILLKPVSEIMAAIEPSTTEKDPRPKYRYVGTVDVPMDNGTAQRVHVTVVITPAKRG